MTLSNEDIRSIQEHLQDPTVDQFRVYQELGAAFQMKTSTILSFKKKVIKEPQRLHATPPEQSGG